MPLIPFMLVVGVSFYCGSKYLGGLLYRFIAWLLRIVWRIVSGIACGAWRLGELMLRRT
ncbi:hypothetical protein [Magnetospirillum sp. ME-1]|uniref:hypothetical protein n=1 Tax=Magnetospirillum sp. ME-1 TaxID=1639348 RepID=UPI00143DB08B|nr:hypothetical protein [Magnetospirillum sp. ME-1]